MLDQDKRRGTEFRLPSFQLDTSVFVWESVSDQKIAHLETNRVIAALKALRHPKSSFQQTVKTVMTTKALATLL